MQKYCIFLIQKSWKWTKKFLDPEIIEMVLFLDPETSEIHLFLDPKIVKMDQQICGSRIVEINKLEEILSVIVYALTT